MWRQAFSPIDIGQENWRVMRKDARANRNWGHRKYYTDENKWTHTYKEGDSRIDYYCCISICFPMHIMSMCYSCPHPTLLLAERREKSLNIPLVNHETMIAGHVMRLFDTYVRYRVCVLVCAVGDARDKFYIVLPPTRTPIVITMTEERYFRWNDEVSMLKFNRRYALPLVGLWNEGFKMMWLILNLMILRH